MSTDKKKWIIELAEKNPILAVVALLLIGISSTAAAFMNERSEVMKDRDRIIAENTLLRGEKDSILKHWRDDIERCNRDLVNRLDAVNEEMKKKLDQQVEFNMSQQRKVQQQQAVVERNNRKIKQLEDEN